MRLILAAIYGLACGYHYIGMGKGDITGPIVEIPFMGYGDAKQTGKGLHTRKGQAVFTIFGNVYK